LKPILYDADISPTVARQWSGETFLRAIPAAHNSLFAYDNRVTRPAPPTSRIPDVIILGAGIIGLSLALELHARGAAVTVLERDSALSHASTAAAGMLAAHDPHNPSALLTLSIYSLSLYPAYLSRIERLSGLPVPLQTDTAVQHLPDGTTLRFAEHSLDPRMLAPALLAAVRSTSITLLEQQTQHPFKLLRENPSAQLVYAAGAWSTQIFPIPVTPRKGQMLRVQLPSSLDLSEVHRTEHIYVCPRTQGPQAGTALIGATVEDAGFDTTTSPVDLSRLRALAAELLPALADPALAPEVESWAGLRPSTPDSLPVIGRLPHRQAIATGHYRNGILLAPATAAVLADLLESRSSAVDLAPFRPTRFANPQ
jgi:glycine oxidase